MNKLLTLFTALVILGGLALAQAPADTFVYQSFSAGPVSLDPVRAYDSASGGILENIYETLYTFNDPAIDEFVPALATSYSVSEDGTTWTFQLRDGVQFHSGNTMSCKDVEYSLQYGLVVAHPEGAVSYLMGGQFLGTLADGSDPEGYQAEVSWEMIDGAVECPDGPDGLVVDLNITAPDPALLAILAYTAFSVIDSQFAIENGQWDGTEATWTDWIGRNVTEEFLQRNASGTGPYQLVEWTEEALVAKRFDDYWGGAAPIENVVVQYVNEQSTRTLAIQQGDADAIDVPERASLVQLRGSPGVVIFEGDLPDTSIDNVFFNYAIDTSNNEDVGSGQLDGNGIPGDFFTDVNVRRGFAHLFDHQLIIDEIYEGNGYVVTMPMPAAFLGYNPDVPVRTLDLEAAEQYFRAAFGGELWEKGFEFTALHNAGNTRRQTALEVIKSNLEFLNPKFRMNVRGLPWSDFLARTGERKTPMFALGWGADYADPKNFINTFLDNDGFYSGRTSVDFPEIQALIDQADSIVDPAERAFLYKEIGILVYDLVPILPLPEQANYLVVSDRLEGVYYNPIRSSDINFLWKDISKN